VDVGVGWGADAGPGAPGPTFAHDVFISYSRRDIAFARALTKALEAYSPPRDLNLGQRRVNVFRDEGDFTGVDYDNAIERHLGDSRKLVVICSPHALASRYVNDEIRRFVAQHGAESIIPVLVAGLPNNEAGPGGEDKRAFPEALCAVMTMPLAADYRGFRPGKDRISSGGFENPWFTLLANLYGVSRRELEQREKKRQARNRRIRNAVVLAIVAALSILSVWALWERDTAIRNANVALSRLLAAQSRAEMKQSWDSLLVSALLAVESVTRAPTAEGVDAVTSGSSLLPDLPMTLLDKSGEAWATDPGGTVVVVKEPARIVVKRLTRGSEVGALSAESCGSSCTDLTAMAVSESGRYLITAAGRLATVFRLDQGAYVPTGIQCRRGGSDGRITAIAVSPDGRMLGAVAGRGNEYGIDVARLTAPGEACATVDVVGGMSEPAAVAFSPDGTAASFGGTDLRMPRRVGVAGLWSLDALAGSPEQPPQRVEPKGGLALEGHVSRVAVGQQSFGGGAVLLATEVTDGVRFHVAVWRDVNGEFQEVARLPAAERSLLGFTAGGSAVAVYDAKADRVLAWPLPARPGGRVTRRGPNEPPLSPSGSKTADWSLPPGARWRKGRNSPTRPRFHSGGRRMRLR
jgi:hypothetical protein